MTSKTTAPAVSLEGASKSFGEKSVLSDVSLSISAGEVVSIIGSSGAGKSTILRCLTLLETLDAGRLAYGDLTVCENDATGRARYDRAARTEAHMRFGIVFQDYNLFPHYSVLRNVTDAPVTVQRRDPSEVEAEARELLRRLDLLEHADKVPCELSGGQQQRVAIARALAMRPSVMFFDEATSALDPKLTNDMHALIRELARDGMAVGIVTHEMGFARMVSDRICLLHDGRIIESGTPEEVIDHPKNELTREFLANVAD
ncbi:amino acid ABC transporter ATP-binding protein [Olsenella intestinalis]|uniref:amino acid ABC transporter ATP-binding protein n=1 Tax=Olsenella intestinalis TaxID=2930083 RepID=UPI00200D0095|nr:amino acid ABC transporter ATP-binding protein [Olsenella intestinalis]